MNRLPDDYPSGQNIIRVEIEGFVAEIIGVSPNMIPNALSGRSPGRRRSRCRVHHRSAKHKRIYFRYISNRRIRLAVANS